MTGSSTKRSRGVAMLALALALTGCTSGGDEPQRDTADPGPAPIFSSGNLTGISSEVRLDEAFREQLTASWPAMNGFGGAVVREDGVLELPITGGSLSYYGSEGDTKPYADGLVEHTGSGISLTRPNNVVTVEISDLALDLDDEVLTADVRTVRATGSATTEEVGQDVTLGSVRMDGDSAPLERNEFERTAALTGLQVSLSVDGATALNEAVGEERFSAQAPLGTLRVVVNDDAE